MVSVEQFQAPEIEAHVIHFSCKALSLPDGIGDLNWPCSFTQAINNAFGTITKKYTHTHSLFARLQTQPPTFLN